MAKKMREKLNKVFRGMVYALPGVLFFSYWPVISLGGNESTNFELSLPLIWLVLFDLLVVVMLARRREFWRGILRHWVWLLLPAWLTVSVVWSLNPLRGVLTVGILWLLYLAGYGMYSLRDLFSGVGAREKFWKCFFGSTLVVCGWCFLQCVLDLVGVPRENSLMCAGCTYRIFGFPHPNGFAAEPQFMGNLLLAPIMVAGWRMINGASVKYHAVLLFVFAATLFLTLSRGAIYAAVVGLAAMTIWQGVWQKKWRVLQVWGIIAAAFLFTLNAQGAFAEFSKTDDTYVSGVSKVVNQLSLGKIDLGGREVKQEPKNEGDAGGEAADAASVADEDGGSAGDGGGSGGDSFDGDSSSGDREEALFGGYAEISTNERTRSWEGALNIWSGDAKTMLAGVGIGGATVAMYENGYRDTPKEIINNEYISLLLESGVVGVALLVVTLVLIVKAIWKMKDGRLLMLTLVLSYGVSLLFFSGLPNALHIYLLPVVLSLGFLSGKRNLGDGN